MAVKIYPGTAATIMAKDSLPKKMYSVKRANTDAIGPATHTAHMRFCAKYKMMPTTIGTAWQWPR